MVLEVGSGRLKEGDITELMSLIGPNFALIESGKVCGPQHLNQSARLAKKAHEGKYNLSKDRSTELLLYLTAQRQISKAIEIAGVNASTKTVAWVAFDQVPARLSDLLELDESVISHTDFDYSTLGLDEDVLERLDFDEKQKIVMTRTATLPVQSR